VDPRENADRPGMTVHRRRGDHWQRPIRVNVGETYETRLLPGLPITFEADEGDAEG
jgi:hypothetical protein